MRTHLLPAALSSLLAVCCVHPAFAQAPAGQQPGPPSAGVLVAVVDIEYVFKQHTGLQQQKERFLAEVQAFEAQHTERRKQLIKKTERLRTYTSGSPEYRQLEAEIARDQSDLQCEFQLKRKEFVTREAKAIYDAYNDVVAAVAVVANRYNIGLVLRFDRESIDPLNRNSVLRGVSRSVVYQNSLDISQLVADQVLAAGKMSRPPGPQRR
jgi:Skp family chaperone for outer membrane proteins